MKESSEQKRYNIKQVRKLNKEEQEYLAVNVVKKIESMIVDFDGDYMYEHILKANIYLAKIPEKYTDVNYIIDSNSIFIRDTRDLKLIDENLICELIHYIECNKQEYKIGKMPEQIRLCKFHLHKISGLALNEVAIQTIISIVFNNPTVENNISGIHIKSIQNKPFPILGALFSQITYITGYKELLNSILKNTDDFQDIFEQTVRIKSYSFLKAAFDDMMIARDKTAQLNRDIKLEKNEKKIKKMQNKIKKYQKKIKKLFLDVQKLCYTEYFRPMIKKVKTKEDLEKLKQEINRYHEKTGIVDDKDDFMIYAQKRLRKLNKNINNRQNNSKTKSF